MNERLRLNAGLRTCPPDPLRFIDTGLVDHVLHCLWRVSILPLTHFNFPLRGAVIFELCPNLVRTEIRTMMNKAVLFKKLCYVAVAPVV